MAAFNQLNAYYKQGIVQKAKELNYSDANVLILLGDEEALKSKYPDVYANLLTCKHNKDSRTYIKYAQDLVASWVFEDDLMSQLAAGGLIIQGAGADKERKILSRAKVSAGSDFLVSWQGKQVLLELMSDYSGYWKRNGYLDLRDSKYNKLKNSSSLFLGISTQDQKFLFLDFSTDIDATFVEHHPPYGFKPAYQVHFDRENLLPFDVKRLVEVIKSAMER